MWKRLLALLALCAAGSLANAAPLSYLSPGSISGGALFTSTGYSDVGTPSFFSSVSSIEVLPAFQSDGVTPYSLLGSGFVGGVDDASHVGFRTGMSFAHLFPKAVKPGGVYIIEDLFYQPADREPADAIKTVGMLRRAEVTGEFTGSHLSEEARVYLNEHVERVALFDSLAARRTIRNRDGIGVIWKKA